ncbi:MAG: DUF3611 family protein, partial [Thermosynechococcaceae cyanobacterium]
MLTQYRPAEVPAPLIKLAATFRFYGWIGFCLQLVLAFLAAIALLFAISGRAFSQDAASGGGFAIFWGICGIMLLVLGILFSFWYIRIAKGLMHEPGATLHPRKSGAIRLLRLGILIGFVGILLALFGSGASVGVLVAKTVSQPPGIAILDPNKIVRAMDVFVVLANITLIAAHLAGTVIAFWLLDRVHHYHYSHPY